MAEPTMPLTPSELVLLNGEKFAKKVLVGNTTLLHNDEKVSVSDLGLAVLAAAFLGCEQAGGVHLEVRPRKVLFGLRTIDVLYVDAAEGGGSLPEASLEGHIAATARKGSEIDGAGWTLLVEDSPNPWDYALGLVKMGLAARGLLERTEERKLKIFTSIHYSLPDSTAALLLSASCEGVQRLLAETPTSRPQVWKLLVSGIKSAVRSRTEQQETGND